MKKVVAIYHKDCNDGTTAGAVVLRKFPEAQLFPVSNSYTKEDIDPIIKILDEDTEIYTVDCTIGVKQILASGFKVTTVDHHISSKEEFEKIAKENPNFTYVFDNSKSGGSLSWVYFFPEEETPEFIKLVEDFDLWNWKYGEDTKNIGNYMSEFRDKPEEVVKFIDSDLTQIKNEGKVISKYTEREIEEELTTKPLRIKIGNNEVLAYNIVSYRSQIGDLLSKRELQTVVLFNIDGDKVKLSFRSQEDSNPSALNLASILGGGGHKQSSGAAVSLSKFLEMIVK